MGEFTRRVHTAWPCLGLPVKSPWLEPGRPFLENSPLTLYSLPQERIMTQEQKEREVACNDHTKD